MLYVLVAFTTTEKHQFNKMETCSSNYSIPMILPVLSYSTWVHKDEACEV